MLFSRVLPLLTLLTSVRANDNIVGGVPVDIADYPYVVALEHGGIEICGGTIIASDRILTAAHCADKFDHRQITVRSGSSYLESGGNVTRVQSAKIHPKYDRRSVDYDVAVFTLANLLPWGANMALQPSGATPDLGSSAVVAGWGSLINRGPQPFQLHAVTVPLVDTEECKWDYPGRITDRMICYGTYGKDACNGDSGSGLVSDGHVVGIVSWGRGCAGVDSAGVYTDVSDPEIHSFITSCL